MSTRQGIPGRDFIPTAEDLQSGQFRGSEPVPGRDFIPPSEPIAPDFIDADSEQELLRDAIRIEAPKSEPPGILKPIAVGMDLVAGAASGIIGTPRAALEILDASSRFVGEKITGKDQGRGAAGQIAQFLPSSEAVDEQLPTVFSPTSRRIGEFAGTTLLTPGGGKFLRSLPGIASTVAAGSTDRLLEDSDPLTRILGGLVAGGLGGVAGGLLESGANVASQARKGAGVVSALQQEAKETAGQVAGKFLNPQQVREQVVADFKAGKIPVNLSTATEGGIVPSGIASAESILSKSFLGEGQFQKQLKSLQNSTISEWESALNRAGLRSRMSAETGQIRFQEFVEERLKDWRAADREAYAIADSLLQPGEMVNATPFINQQRQFLKSLEKSFTPHPNENAFIKDLRKNIKTLESRAVKQGGKFMVPVDRMLATKRSLNRLSDFEYGASLKKLYNQSAKIANGIIESHGKQNPEFLKAFRAADLGVANRKQVLENRLISGLMKAESPEALLHKMGTKEGFDAVRAAVSKGPKGKSLWDSLRRMKVDRLIGDDLVIAMENARFGTAANKLGKPKMRAQLERLLGKKEFARVQLLKKNMASLAKNSARFANPSGTAQSLQNFSTGKILITSLATAAVTGNPLAIKAAIPGLSAAAAANITAKLLADPVFIEATLQAARANGESAFSKAIARASGRASIAMREVVEAEDTQNKLTKQSEGSGP